MDVSGDDRQSLLSGYGGEEPVVLGNGGLGAPLAAVVMAACDEDAGLSRGLVVLKRGDRPAFVRGMANLRKTTQWGSTPFRYPIKGRFPKALPTIGR
jgi:hypothetical protein